MQDGRLGFGLIGASTISREWMIEALRATGSTAPVALYSRDLARGRAFAAETGIPRAYDRLDALLADPEVDAVYVASTNERHHREVLAAAAAGKHVLCEKPLAMTLDQGLQMIEACERAGVVLAVNHHLRNAAHHIAMRDAVREGRIGRPVVIRIAHGALLPPHLQTWRIRDAVAGAGAVLDLTVHDADLLRFLLDDEIAEVTAMAANSGMGSGGIEDTALTVLRTNGGVLGQMQDVFNTPHNRGAVEIHGTQGSLYGLDVMSQAPRGRVTLRDASGERELPLQQENLYVRGLRRFVAATRGEDTVPCTGRDGLRSLTAALAVLESARSGRAVAVSEVA
jgi:1,5-anhydro-D-fructose reductase (1,5-anhydro-D-mannitol-forming)